MEKLNAMPLLGYYNRLCEYNRQFAERMKQIQAEIEEQYMSDLTFDEYQNGAAQTAIYPEANMGSVGALSYVTLGLVGEAGEIANKVKKVIRDSGGVVSTQTRFDLSKEVGDVLWYVARLADELGVPLGYLAQHNLDKLGDRKDRGVLGGSGDDR